MDALGLDAMAGSSVDKCGKCGSRKDLTKDCSVDKSKVKCFQCSQVGHVSANYLEKNVSSPKGKSDKGVIKGFGKTKSQAKGKGKEKGKEKGKGKGKYKGKLNHVGWDDGYDGTDWWYFDDSDQWWTNPTWTQAEDHGPELGRLGSRTDARGRWKSARSSVVGHVCFLRNRVARLKQV